MDLPTIIPYIAFALSGYATLNGHFVSRAQAKRDERLTVLEKQMDLFWGIVEKHMTTVLHSPHTPDLDALLERYQAGEQLTDEEAEELSHRLLTVINDPDETKGARAVAVFVLAALSLRYDLDMPEVGGSEANG